MTTPADELAAPLEQPARGGRTKHRSTFTPAPWATVAYFALFALYGGIALAYVSPDLRFVDIEAVLPGFHTHLSNWVLSGVLVMIYGLVRMMYGATTREIAIFTLAVIAGNYVYEVFLTLHNTKDLVDAHYGAASATATFGVMAVLRRHGLRPAGPRDQAPSSVPD